MQWTHEKPEVPGWYWRRWKGGGLAIVLVFDEHGKLYWGDPDDCDSGRASLDPRDDLHPEISKHDEWAGPIPEPAEAKK